MSSSKLVAVDGGVGAGRACGVGFTGALVRRVAEAGTATRRGATGRLVGAVAAAA